MSAILFRPQYQYLRVRSTEHIVFMFFEAINDLKCVYIEQLAV